MLTLAKYVKFLSVLLGCLILSGSSNRFGAIGFWHVLNSKANVLQSYWQTPSYFRSHVSQLPDTQLAKLARLSIPLAQYRYSLRLINSGHANTAKVFWRAGASNLSVEHRKTLAEQLLVHSRWQDLALLANEKLLPEGNEKNHLKLELSTHYSQVSNEFINQLGFASISDDIEPQTQCLFNVLTMSNHRSGLYKLNELISRYDQAPEPRKHVFCFSMPVYVAGAVKCSIDKNQAAQCSVQTPKLIKSVTENFDFIIMMPKYGTANVTNNTMLINSDAQYHVFLHELMHFNGFEDEYALPLTKQAWLCTQRGLVAPNLYISDGKQKPQGWHKANSCQKGGIAYKPSENWSIMEYQQLGLSDQYRALWLNQLDIVNDHLKRLPSAPTSTNKGVKN
ncbi:hypothetical protein PspMM1_10770 [Pseudoalteromonas sp. MM1]|uniref:hypothetical protein n=1 Tax=Pseudoalteromonas sp. MM1 TaxID=3036714 RepID=UPI002572BB7E|nr:hypothetical protein [Pseudoalteromonas sp. MM1]BED88609.1 hypothetical protein PspMM1_10770 [Pseudoalteromonas sp. MM1]